MDRHDLPAFRNASTIAQFNTTIIGVSRWDRPDECEFSGEHFQRLKESIAIWGGNQQPIQIRHGLDATRSDHSCSHEIVFGHARYRACVELGLPVLAMSDKMTDEHAFRQSAIDLATDIRWRPWRLGRMISSEIDADLFPTMRRLAHALSMDLTEVWQLQQIGDLPCGVRRAFGNLPMTPAFARKLVNAYSRDSELIQRNANEHRFGECASATAVLAALTRKCA